MKRKVLALALAAAMTAGIFTGCKSEEAPQQPATEQTGGDQANNGGDAASEEIKEQNLKMNITIAETSTWMKAAEKLSADVEADTGGKVKIKVYPNEQLSGGNQSKGVEMVMSGATDVDIHSNIIYSVVDERFSLLSLPFFFENEEDADAKLAGEGAEAIKKLMAEKGVQWLGFGESGMRQITNSKHPIKTVDDLKGLKIRVPGMKMYLDTFTAMGANPISMNWSETFTALQQGAVDGQENPNDIIMTSAIDEVQKYITLWDYSYDCLLFGINKKLYDSYPASLQQIFTDRGLEAANYQKGLIREQNQKALDEMVARTGLEVYTPTPEERQTFIDSTKDIVAKYRDIIGPEFFDPFTKVEEGAQLNATEPSTTDEQPTETEAPATDEQPAETEAPAADEQPAETETPAADEQPAETETPAAE